MKNLMANVTAKATMKMMAAKARVKEMLRDERGEVNLIAILLIIVVVVGLVIIFRDNIEDLIDSIFNNINEGIEEV
ncbi:MAG: hypothetical protein E7510_03695 [Ruminococcus sp.]|jgi:hypothetical protein|nr:hypothetical protein [Ruminococcus sp.]MBR6599634.1 hypothetical protein [Oscillospiraceae bacterium]